MAISETPKLKKKIYIYIYIYTHTHIHTHTLAGIFKKIKNTKRFNSL